MSLNSKSINSFTINNSVGSVVLYSFAKIVVSTTSNIEVNANLNSSLSSINVGVISSNLDVSSSLLGSLSSIVVDSRGVLKVDVNLSGTSNIMSSTYGNLDVIALLQGIQSNIQLDNITSILYIECSLNATLSNIDVTSIGKRVFGFSTRPAEDILRYDLNPYTFTLNTVPYRFG
jgi:hypothetical protein